MYYLKRWLPLLIILSGFFAFFQFNLYRYLSFENLRAHQYLLLTWTHSHFVTAIFLYMTGYVITILCAIPSSLICMLIAGYLFGAWCGFLCVYVGAIIGSTLFFLIIKTSLLEMIEEKMSERVRVFEKGFQKNAFNYILMLRLIPIFPFFLVNIASALFGVRLFAFCMATMLGIVPATIIYTSIGSNLGVFFSQDVPPSLNLIFQPHFLIPLLFLAVLAILPVLCKYK
jgi:uncharacterized membrane protein YdjX (TVP38/TMEM64 family)